MLNLTLTASSLPSLPGLGAQPWSCSDRPALIETRATRSRQSQRPNDAQVAAKSRFAAHESQSPKGRLCLLRSSWSTSTRRKSRAVSSPSDVYEQALKRIANRAAEPVLQWRRYTAGRKLTPWTVASIGCSSAAGKELMAASTMILGGRGERDITRSVNTYTRSSAPHPRLNAHVGLTGFVAGPPAPSGRSTAKRRDATRRQLFDLRVCVTDGVSKGPHRGALARTTVGALSRDKYSENLETRGHRSEEPEGRSFVSCQAPEEL